MSSIPVEAKVVLALEALENDPKLSLKATARLYSVPYATLHCRRADQPIRRDILANSRNLMDLEE
jgi:hypothetical protein